MAKITLESLLNKKLAEGFQSKEVEIPNLGGTITVVKQPITTIMRVIDELDKADDMVAKFNTLAKLIYKCVPLFHNKELQEKYQCAEPEDIVYKVLDDNMQDIETLGSAIMEFYGVAEKEELKETIKK